MRGVVLVLAAMTIGCTGEPRGSVTVVSDPAPRVTRVADAVVERACERASRRVMVRVLCPARLPVGGFETPREYGDAPCSYLLDLEPRDMGDAPRPAFHVLFGGSCRVWDMRTDGRRWPRDPEATRARGDLRLIGAVALEPGQTEEDERLVPLEVLRRARVGSAPALVLRNPPYPAGGIHGGHLTVVWNAGGAGYAVSGHVPEDDGAREVLPTTAALLETARSTEPAS